MAATVKCAMSELLLSSEIFRPPVNRAMRELDRSFFRRIVPLAAARVYENDQISRCRADLGRDLLQLERVGSVRSDPEDGKERKNARKLLLLKPGIRPQDPSTWTSRLQHLIQENKVAVTPYDLELNYDAWTYRKYVSPWLMSEFAENMADEIMSAILPEDDHDEIPTGFSVVGHIAHLNLREQYLQHKHLIAAVLMDKNPTIRTVINKTDDVGTQNEYRTFQYELLAGDPSMDVDVKVLDCAFRFNYSKVYWNSRLNTEHERLVSLFQPGEVVCDVMAGVGPFAVPAAKRKVFVWANDLNPESYASLRDAMVRNKVSRFLKPFNEDGRSFIRATAQRLLEDDLQIDVTPMPKARRRSGGAEPLKPVPPSQRKYLRQPRTFQHYVMNLPATAITFLDAFVGLYKGYENLFGPNASTKLPMIHVYCFSTKSDDNGPEKVKICREISDRVGYTIGPEDREVEIWDVRDVAPSKRMFCASFRLPPEVAFR